jgi:hypothetical protein
MQSEQMTEGRCQKRQQAQGTKAQDGKIEQSPAVRPEKAVS